MAETIEIAEHEAARDRWLDLSESDIVAFERSR